MKDSSGKIRAAPEKKAVPPSFFWLNNWRRGGGGRVNQTAKTIPWYLVRTRYRVRYKGMKNTQVFGISTPSVGSLQCIWKSRSSNGALRLSPPFSVNGWAWIQTAAATIRQGAKKSTDATALYTKLSISERTPSQLFSLPCSVVSPTHDFRDSAHTCSPKR